MHRSLSVVIAATVLALSTAPAAGASIPWRPALPIARTFIEHFGSGYQPDVDLRPTIHRYGLRIRNQGDRGTCTVFATTFLIEFQKESQGAPPGLHLSEEYLNWAGNKATGEDADGGFFTKFIPGFAAYAISTAKQMRYRKTYNPAHPDTPSAATIASAEAAFPARSRYHFEILKVWNDQTGMTKAELQNILTILRSGRPVATGIWWLTNFSTVTIHGIPLLKDYPRSANTGSNPPMFDGHSIDLVGFKKSRAFPGGGYFIFRNSFGPKFGDHGYGFLSFQYIRAYANDGIAIEPAAPINRPHCHGTSCS